MVNFNSCILLGILLFMGNCLKNNKSEIPFRNLNFCKYPRLIEYVPQDPLEKKALVKIREYLLNLELDEKYFYVGGIEYADESENLDKYANYTILIELLHLKTVIYFDSVRSINQNLVDEVDEEFIEIFIPKSGNISGMDRIFYYYAETDTLDGLLIQ